jgi:hypothetical protein
MANIHINRSGTTLGIFSEEEVREGLRSGRFILTDLGWREGMSSWQALSQFPEFATGMPGAPAPGRPEGSAVVATTATATGQTGLPWDRRHELGLLNAFLETLKMVLSQPTQAFSSMKTEGGFGEPLIYLLIGGTFGCFFSILFTVAMSSFGVFSDRHNPLVNMLGMGFGVVFGIILIPFFLAMCVFISSAIVHLCLMLVGGAKKPFETTFRVNCFVGG